MCCYIFCSIQFTLFSFLMHLLERGHTSMLFMFGLLLFTLTSCFVNASRVTIPLYKKWTPQKQIISDSIHDCFDWKTIEHPTAETSRRLTTIQVILNSRHFMWSIKHLYKCYYKYYFRAVLYILISPRPIASWLFIASLSYLSTDLGLSTLQLKSGTYLHCASKELAFSN